MYKVPKQEHVDLKQVKLKDDAVEFKATATFTDGESVYVNDLNEKYVFPAHPDLKNALEKLKIPLATLCGLIDCETMIRAKEYGPSKDQLAILDDYLVHKLSKIKVTGIALSGKDGNRGVIITGTYNGQAINNRKVKFTSDLDFENDLEEAVDLIEDETYKYVFEGKKADETEFMNDDSQLPIEEEEEKDFKSAAAGDS